MMFGAILIQSVALVPPQALILMQIPEKGAAADERQARTRQPFFRQPLLPAGEAAILYEKKALDAFRDRFNLDDHAPFSLYELVEKPDGEYASFRHRDYVFCSVYLKLGKGACAACFRDEDRDGKLEAVATFEGGIPAGGLVFQPISPVAYRYVDHRGERQPYSMYTQESLGAEYSFDKKSGLLRFTALVNGYPLGKAVELDPKALPTTLEVSGAIVRVSAWNGKRATIAVQQPFPQIPLRIDLPTPRAAKARLPARVTFASEPMPGEAASPSAAVADAGGGH